MKTYKEFIIELNKVEAMMKAGKLAVSTIRRVSPNLLKGVKITGKKVKVPSSNIISNRNSPVSKIITPRRKVENMMQNQNKSYKNTIFDPAKRQKDFRGKGKKQSAELDKMGKPLVRGFGDSNRQLDLPASYKASNQMNIGSMSDGIYRQLPRDMMKRTPVYNKNTRGRITTKGVNYDKVPDSIENKIRDAIRQRKKKN